MTVYFTSERFRYYKFFQYRKGRTNKNLKVGGAGWGQNSGFFSSRILKSQRVNASITMPIHEAMKLIGSTWHIHFWFIWSSKLFFAYFFFFFLEGGGGWENMSTLLSVYSHTHSQERCYLIFMNLQNGTLYRLSNTTI